jgi:hypothetical protein
MATRTVALCKPHHQAVSMRHEIKGQRPFKWCMPHGAHHHAVALEPALNQ